VSRIDRPRVVRFLVAVLAAILVAPGAGTGPIPSSLASIRVENRDLARAVMRFDPSTSQAPPARGSGGGGGRAQPGEAWDGAAPPPDSLGLTGGADVHEFQVLSGFDNDLLTVAISWDAGPALSHDPDLLVDGLDASGRWLEVGGSTGGQLLGDGEAEKVAEVRFPSPGAYRASVVNFASTELACHGSPGFTSGKRGDGRPSRARATEDRPDEAEGPQLHAIYFVPSDGQDGTLDTNGTIENALASMNLWLDGRTGGRHLRLDT
jgi:hypothetical protein